MYSAESHDVPLVRNMPAISGRICWVRHLYKRIHDPMKIFAVSINDIILHVYAS